LARTLLHYDFYKESSTEYQGWAVDVPGEFFSAVLEDWRKGSKNQRDLAEMDEFIERDCPDWVSSSRKRRG